MNIYEKAKAIAFAALGIMGFVNLAIGAANGTLSMTLTGIVLVIFAGYALWDMRPITCYCTVQVIEADLTFESYWALENVDDGYRMRVLITDHEFKAGIKAGRIRIAKNDKYRMNIHIGMGRARDGFDYPVLLGTDITHYPAQETTP